MTVTHALREYGVVVSSETCEADMQATARERAARSAAGAQALQSNDKA
jgi:hypothetical protein